MDEYDPPEPLDATTLEEITEDYGHDERVQWLLARCEWLEHQLR